ncbi:MAG: DUF2171 domain-containing protein [Roseiflexaceae bacterium]|nr:DUF2171 domain-containing protein [Roseiflexaceae bacterium]
MQDDMAMSIREHMEIVGEDGRHVGTVDKVEGTMIKLTKTDAEAGGHHHYLPLDLVSAVEGNTVRLMIPGEQALLEQDHEDEDETGQAEDDMDDAKAASDQPA